MGYNYHVFLSYRRYGEWPEWVEKQFLPLFKHWLGEELGEIPKIFIDIESIETGTSWPIKLRKSLAESCVIVPLFSRNYFHSEWCRRELSYLLAREKKCGFNTSDQPQRLIVPAKIHDGKDFPSVIKDIQCACLERCSNVRIAPDSPRREELSDLIETWVPDISSAIQSVPEYDENWLELEIDEFMQQFDDQRPKQKALPRLGQLWVQ